VPNNSRVKQSAAWHKFGGKLWDSAQLQDTTITTMSVYRTKQQDSPPAQDRTVVWYAQPFSTFRCSVVLLSAASHQLTGPLLPTLPFILLRSDREALVHVPSGSRTRVSARPKSCLLPRNKIGAVECRHPGASSVRHAIQSTVSHFVSLFTTIHTYITTQSHY
jgi:hypothetical protein